MSMSKRSFNEAAVRRPRKVRGANLQGVDLRSFNEAAVRRPRKASDFPEVAQIAQIASMRPRSGDRGRFARAFHRASARPSGFNEAAVRRPRKARAVPPLGDS